MMLTRRHLLMILLGAELMMHAAALNFMGSAVATPKAQLVVMCILVVVVAEAALVMALAFVWYKQTGSMQIDVFDKEPAHE